MNVRNKYLLILAGVWTPCLALALAAYAMVLRPQSNHRQDLDARIVQAKDYYTRALEAAKPELQARLTNQVDHLHARIEDFLVRTEDESQLAFAIGNMARETKVESFGIKPVDVKTSLSPEDRDRIAERRLNVSFLAGFTRFAALLNTMERSRPAIFVETFSIDRPEGVEALPRVEMDLAVLVEKPQGS